MRDLISVAVVKQVFRSSGADQDGVKNFMVMVI